MGESTSGTVSRELGIKVKLQPTTAGFKSEIEKLNNRYSILVKVQTENEKTLDTIIEKVNSLKTKKLTIHLNQEETLKELNALKKRVNDAITKIAITVDAKDATANVAYLKKEIEGMSSSFKTTAKQIREASKVIFSGIQTEGTLNAANKELEKRTKSEIARLKEIQKEQNKIQTGWKNISMAANEMKPYTENVNKSAVSQFKADLIYLKKEIKSIGEMESPISQYISDTEKLSDVLDNVTYTFELMSKMDLTRYTGLKKEQMKEPVALIQKIKNELNKLYDIDSAGYKNSGLVETITTDITNLQKMLGFLKQAQMKVLETEDAVRERIKKGMIADGYDFSNPDVKSSDVDKQIKVSAAAQTEAIRKIIRAQNDLTTAKGETLQKDEEMLQSLGGYLDTLKQFAQEIKAMTASADSAAVSAMAGDTVDSKTAEKANLTVQEAIKNLKIILGEVLKFMTEVSNLTKEFKLTVKDGKLGSSAIVQAQQEYNTAISRMDPEKLAAMAKAMTEFLQKLAELKPVIDSLNVGQGKEEKKTGTDETAKQQEELEKVKNEFYVLSEVCQSVSTELIKTISAFEAVKKKSETVESAGKVISSAMVAIHNTLAEYNKISDALKAVKEEQPAQKNPKTKKKNESEANKDKKAKAEAEEAQAQLEKVVKTATDVSNSINFIIKTFEKIENGANGLNTKAPAIVSAADAVNGILNKFYELGDAGGKEAVVADNVSELIGMVENVKKSMERASEYIDALQNFIAKTQGLFVGMGTAAPEMEKQFAGIYDSLEKIKELFVKFGAVSDIASSQFIKEDGKTETLNVDYAQKQKEAEEIEQYLLLMQGFADKTGSVLKEINSSFEGLYFNDEIFAKTSNISDIVKTVSGELSACAEFVGVLNSAIVTISDKISGLKKISDKVDKLGEKVNENSAGTEALSDKIQNATSAIATTGKAATKIKQILEKYEALSEPAEGFLSVSDKIIKAAKALKQIFADYGAIAVEIKAKADELSKQQAAAGKGAGASKSKNPVADTERKKQDEIEKKGKQLATLYNQLSVWEAKEHTLSINTKGIDEQLTRVKQNISDVMQEISDLETDLMAMGFTDQNGLFDYASFSKKAGKSGFGLAYNNYLRKTNDVSGKSIDAEIDKMYKAADAAKQLEVQLEKIGVEASSGLVGGIDSLIDSFIGDITKANTLQDILTTFTEYEELLNHITQEMNGSYGEAVKKIRSLIKAEKELGDARNNVLRFDGDKNGEMFSGLLEKENAAQKKVDALKKSLNDEGIHYGAFQEYSDTMSRIADSTVKAMEAVDAARKKSADKFNTAELKEYTKQLEQAKTNAFELENKLGSIGYKTSTHDLRWKYGSEAVKIQNNLDANNQGASTEQQAKNTKQAAEEMLSYEEKLQAAYAETLSYINKYVEAKKNEAVIGEEIRIAETKGIDKQSEAYLSLRQEEKKNIEEKKNALQWLNKNAERWEASDEYKSANEKAEKEIEAVKKTAKNAIDSKNEKELKSAKSTFEKQNEEAQKYLALLEKIGVQTKKYQDDIDNTNKRLSVDVKSAKTDSEMIDANQRAAKSVEDTTAAMKADYEEVAGMLDKLFAAQKKLEESNLRIEKLKRDGVSEKSGEYAIESGKNDLYLKQVLDYSEQLEKKVPRFDKTNEFVKRQIELFEFLSAAYERAGESAARFKDKADNIKLNEAVSGFEKAVSETEKYIGLLEKAGQDVSELKARLTADKNNLTIAENSATTTAELAKENEKYAASVSKTGDDARKQYELIEEKVNSLVDSLIQLAKAQNEAAILEERGMGAGYEQYENLQAIIAGLIPAIQKLKQELVQKGVNLNAFDVYTDALERMNQASQEAEEEIRKLHDSMVSRNETSAAATAKAEMENLKTYIKSIDSYITQLTNDKNKNLEQGTGLFGDIEGDIKKLEEIKARLIEISDAGDHGKLVDYLNELSAAIDGMFGKSEKETIAIETIKDAMNVLTQTFNADKDAIRQHVEALREQKREMANTTQLNNLIKQMDTFVAVNERLKGTKVGEEIKNLIESAKAPDAVKNLTALKERFSELRLEAQKSGLIGDNIVDKLKKIFGSHFSNMMVSNVFSGFSMALRGVYQNVVSLDTAMTELRKVTEETDYTYQKFTKSAANSAKEIGASVSKFVNVTADWARLGNTLAESENLAKYTILLSNVGDGIDSVDTAAQYMISTLNGFQLPNADIERVVDMINQVANTEPVSANDIGEFLQRSSSAMAVANSTVEETIALGTAMNSVVQNAATTGTTLKTLSMYLRAAKQEAADAGEETEGMASSVAKLQQDLLKLANVDIMQDDGTTFKSPYQIMKELSEVWNKIADVDQAYILEKIGGKRNANAVSALLNNFALAEDSLKQATNSAGSAMREQEVYLESIQGRLQLFNAAYESLSNNVLNSGLIKGIVSLGTNILNFIDIITQATGALPLFTAALTTAMTVYNVKAVSSGGEIVVPAYADYDLKTA